VLLEWFCSVESGEAEDENTAIDGQFGRVGEEKQAGKREVHYYHVVEDITVAVVRTSYRREKEQTNDNTVRFLQPASTFAMMMVMGIVGRKLLIMAIPAQPNGPSHLLAEDGCRVRDCRS
jgi:hypothetical protein